MYVYCIMHRWIYIYIHACVYVVLSLSSYTSYMHKICGGGFIKHLATIAGGFWVHVSTWNLGRNVLIKQSQRIPEDPCMEYLPTLTPKVI